MGLATTALALLVAVAATHVLAHYEYDYGYGYDSYYLGDLESYYYDDDGYYGDEDISYYEYYGHYSKDRYSGWSDYYTYEMDGHGGQRCFLDVNGKPVLSSGTAACDVRIRGVDKQADHLPGGIDGVYELTSCHNGKPLYLRKNSPPGEERTLWYSNTFGDWDVSLGARPDEITIAMYGGELEHASVPLFVQSWHLSGDYRSDTVLGEDHYLPVSVKVTCADGIEYDEDEVETHDRAGPVLTDEEMEAKYRYIMDRYYTRPPPPSPSMTYSFVVLIVMGCVTAVLAIPYFMLKRKSAMRAKYAPVPTTLSQLLSQQGRIKGGRFD
ncbi:hypothetical protein HYH03_005235 [Edaphochlamys debaryana]|uniref:Uncharacterized protein n=1 Tax=Edaphochlamys debaryana TaxID=47281 RepID=A0A835Y622_9CHLO|nr:hypothetical protein HYH03_005235 [Edaphochlamys debaryana]|eukprot:KAG2496830.1 hypothetical protein HYH03_005235 [Edaphochlamys debaryana]